MVGSVTEFGGYDWRVLDVRDGKALLITKAIVEVRAYHGKTGVVTWADCDLRGYLNGEFYESFSPQDRQRIAETRNVNKENPWFWVTPEGGAAYEDTVDKIFLLSIEEVVEHFGDSGRLLQGPLSADASDDEHSFLSDRYNDNRVACDKEGTSFRWWLRTRQARGDCAAYVNADGQIAVDIDPIVLSLASFSDNDNASYLSNVNNEPEGLNIAVRPVLWLIL
jgi:hypothetical protein